jgi:hypothetical protein
MSGKLARLVDRTSFGTSGTLETPKTQRSPAMAFRESRRLLFFRRSRVHLVNSG